jgi:hypothetical protein
MRVAPVSTSWSLSLRVGVALLVTVALCAVLGWFVGVRPPKGWSE